MALALGTPWGPFRHYWVVISLAVTLFATTVLLLHLPTVRTLADRAADPQANPTGLRGDLFHSVGGLVVLVIPLVRNIYKPRGLTHLGWRAQHGSARQDQRRVPDPVDDRIRESMKFCAAARPFSGAQGRPAPIRPEA